MDISFILVEPQNPENVGASARAINTMGFSNLKLVNPCDYLDARARKLAYGSEDILEKAQVFQSLVQVVEGIDLVIATSAKRRTTRFDYHPSHEIFDIIQRKGETISSVGVVFGREDRGLMNEEIALCHLVSYIPLIQPYPSLNLSQAVMIYSYLLSQLNISAGQKENCGIAESEFLSLKRKVGRILDTIDSGPEKLIYNRIMERLALLGEDDIHILHSVTAKLNEKLL